MTSLHLKCLSCLLQRMGGQALLPKSVCVFTMKGTKTKVLLAPHGFRMHLKENITVLETVPGRS